SRALSASTQRAKPVTHSECVSAPVAHSGRGDRMILGSPVSGGARSLHGHADRNSPKTFRALLALPGAQAAVRAGGKATRTRARARARGGPEVLSAALRKTRDETNETHTRASSTQSRGRNVTASSAGLLQDGVFWSEWLEDLLPSAFTEQRARAWRDGVRDRSVVVLESGCGRPSNRLAVFADGARACVRYGISAEQVQGETLSYYLATLLGIGNLPPLALSRLDPTGEQWAAVTDSMGALQWAVSSLVSLTEWIPGLTGAVVPGPLRQGGEGLHPLREDLLSATVTELLELVEWSDLIAFDFLTANFDRLASNLFSLQWDPRATERNVSNLHKTPSGRLLFIDNEAGLVHGYRVLRMWERYHATALGALCVFRRETARRVSRLHSLRDVRQRLLALLRDNEPLAPELGFLSDEHAEILQSRIDILHEHIQRCKAKYSST
uniref:Four-jointed box kinase 1 n=1 Tax=Scleropages formosus TaxID=113540 RepID=A0A8C9TX24_SCLFO